MNCVLVRSFLGRDCFVPMDTPVRVVRLGEGVECVASFALVGGRVVRDVEIVVSADDLRFMGVDPGLFR